MIRLKLNIWAVFLLYVQKFFVILRKVTENKQTDSYEKTSFR